MQGGGEDDLGGGAQTNSAKGGSSETTTLKVDYQYDAWGNMVGRSVTQYTGGKAGTPAVEKYAVDGWKVEQDFWGEHPERVANEAVDKWADVTESGTYLARRVFGDSVDQMVAGYSSYLPGGRVWYMQDRQGSVVGELGGSGGAVTAAYDVWGGVTGTLRDRYGWTGREHDAQAALINLRDRHYEAATGRFWVEDPSGFQAGDANLYRYSFNSPTNGTDPSGHFVFTTIGAFGGMLIGGVVAAAQHGDFNHVMAGAAAGAVIGAGAGLIADTGGAALVPGLVMIGAGTGWAAGSHAFNPDVPVAEVPGEPAPSGGRVEIINEPTTEPSKPPEVRTNAPANSGGGCFAAGTPVRVPGGWKSVEALKPGDLVLSRPENRPEAAVEARTVEEVFVRVGLTLRLRAGGQLLEPTAEHPFFCAGRGWVPASTMTVGDRLATEAGGWVEVEGVEEGQIVSGYNMSVAEYHTYFVGCEDWGFSVWVHNVACSESVRLALEAEGIVVSKDDPRLEIIANHINNGRTGQARSEIKNLSGAGQTPGRTITNIIDAAENPPIRGNPASTVPDGAAGPNASASSARTPAVYNSFADAVGVNGSLTEVEMIGGTNNPGISAQGFTQKWVGKGPDGVWYYANYNPITRRWSFGKESSRNNH